ncbi:NAD-dependent epimerase/dehydratase family protein [Rubrimonas sp.]|uniref:NAD-dependent epimerase/dehydratase family protein n=1 Tax=Rubrimonas sp. TaxID=2036015 RepID=UPI002FDDC887
MKVLVTGSSGWLGRHLVPMLRDAGWSPVGLDVAPGEQTDVVASVADQNAIAALFCRHDFDAVMHGGALHKPDIARFPPQAFVDVNVSGTLNLLRAATARPGARFVFTSTTSLMISQAIRDERATKAVWLDEDAGPLEPRNIYGVTKLAAEGLCRLHHLEHGLAVVVLRTARFFPEDDDTITALSGPNLKANELLHRRATVQDVARACLAALDRAPQIGFGLYVVSAPTPFTRDDLGALKADAPAVIRRLFPEAEALYRRAGWRLPQSIGRVYNGGRITRQLGFVYRTSFGDILEALRCGDPAPIDHDPNYGSPILRASQAEAARR